MPNNKFDFWDFIEKFHPEREQYPHASEIEELEQFLRTPDLMDTQVGSELVCRILSEHGSRYGAEAYMHFLRSQLFMEAYREYYVLNTQEPEL